MNWDSNGRADLRLRWVVAIIIVCGVLSIVVAEIAKMAGPPW